MATRLVASLVTILSSTLFFVGCGGTPTSPAQTTVVVGGQTNDIPQLDAVIPFDGDPNTPQTFGLRGTAAFGTPATSALINGVPWMSQIDTSIGCSGAQTLACGPTAAAMAEAFVMQRPMSAALVKEFVDSAGDHWPCGVKTGIPQLAQILNSHGVANTSRTFDAVALLNAIQSNHPVIAPVLTQNITSNQIDPQGHQHFMLIVGISPSEVIVNDPGRGPTKQNFAQYRHFPLGDFLSAWQTNSPSLSGIEVIGPNAAPPQQTAPGDFAINVSPTTLTVSQGMSAAFTISVTSVNGFGSGVTLNALHLPGDQFLNGTGFVPKIVTPAPGGLATSTLTIATDANTPTGSTPVIVTIHGVSSGTSHDTTLALAVTVATGSAPGADFTVQASPATVSVAQGGTASFNVSVPSLNGFNSPVTLSALNLPGPVLAGTGFNPQVVTPPANGMGSSILTVVTNTTTPAGPTTITVQGQEGSISRKATVSLTVTVPSTSIPPPTLAVTPTSGTQLTNFTVTGSGYTPNGVVNRWVQIPGQAWMQIGSINADGAGSITWPFTPGCGYPLGAALSYAIDATTNRQSPTITEQVAAAPSCQVTLGVTLSVTPTSGTQLTNFTVSGSGYTPNGVVNRWVQIPGQAWMQIGSINADGAGNITWPFTPGCSYPLGAALSYAIDAATNRQSPTITEQVAHASSCP
jgi:hypothetical protein